MSEKHIFERDPADPKRKEINPILKLALELGPLMVFFFANSRGEWLVERFPALGSLGGPLFVATALFMAATAIALTAPGFSPAPCPSCRSFRAWWCSCSAR